MANQPKKLALYRETVLKADYEEIFRRLLVSSYPFMGMIDLTWLYAEAFGMLVKKKCNTLNLYLTSHPKIENFTNMMFPFRVGGSEGVERSTGFVLPIPTMPSANINILDLLTRENICEVNLRIVKVFGMTFAIGSVTTETGARRLLFVPNPTKFLEINLEKYPAMYIEILEPIPKEIHFESQEPVLTGETAKIGVDNFEVLQHGLVVGTSGCGKSKFLELLIRATLKKHGDKVRIVVIDPHTEFSKRFKSAKVIDYRANYLEPFEVGAERNPMVAQLISQLITSIISSNSKYSERINFYAVHLLLAQQALNVENLNLLLTDETARAERVAAADNPEVKRFFDEEFKDVQMHYFNEAILPILNFVGEYNICINKGAKIEKLTEVVARNNFVIISFDPHFFGKRMIRFLAGAIMNQLYLMAVTEQMKIPTLLIVDEFAFVETPVVKEILSETRKFNLFLYISAQYLEQLGKETLDSLAANVKNVFAFKVNRADAKQLASLMEIKVEEFFKRRYSESELEVARAEMFTNLHLRECITRLFDGQRYLLPMKLRTVDVKEVDTDDYRQQIKEFWNSQPSVAAKGERATTEERSAIAKVFWEKHLAGQKGNIMGERNG